MPERRADPASAFRCSPTERCWPGGASFAKTASFPARRRVCCVNPTVHPSRQARAVYGPLTLFSLESGREFGEGVAARLGLELSPHEEREFEYGHHKVRPLVDVAGRDVYVVQSLHGDGEQSVNDRLCRLLFFLGALHDAGTGRLTAVVPYLCYSRKDRRTKEWDPVSTRYVASMFEAVGTDRFMTLEVHNLAAFENAFRRPTVNLTPDEIFADHFATVAEGDGATVVSPDVGGIKRAARFQGVLRNRSGRDVSGAFVEKWRSEGVVGGEAVVGDVEGRHVILYDDMISGGTTTARAAAACRRAGCVAVHVAAAHPVFTREAPITLGTAELSSVGVLNHIPVPEEAAAGLPGLTILDATPLVANGIRELRGSR